VVGAAARQGGAAPPLDIGTRPRLHQRNAKGVKTMPSNVADDDFVISRTFAASVERLWATLT